MYEDFLKFVPVHDVCAITQANTIINELKSLNIDIKNLRNLLNEIGGDMPL